VALPDGRGLVLHPDGAGAGCTQANAAGFAGAGGPEELEDPQAASVAAPTMASAATRTQVERGRLDAAVAVTGAAVVVGIVVPTVVLGNSVVVVVMVVVMVSRKSRSGSADGEGQCGDSGDDQSACSGQHSVHPSR
jgi:hypothetical protein